MIDWVFIWASRRPPIWDQAASNINIAAWPEYTTDGYYAPVSVDLVPERFRHLDLMKKLTGQVVEQFESESLRYVIEDGSPVRADLVMKEFMLPNFELNELNCRAINLDEVLGHVREHGWVALGVIMSNIEINDKSLVAKSYYYTRDRNTLKLINLSGENQPLEHDVVSAMTYIVFKQTKNPDVIAATMNPGLVGIPSIETVISGDHRVTTLNSYTTSIESFFLTPRVEGATLLSNGTIYAENDFKIMDYADSVMYHKYGEVKAFPRRVQSNMFIKNHSDHVEVMINNPTGYVRIEYEVDAMINSYNRVQEAGRYVIDFTIIRG